MVAVGQSGVRRARALPGLSRDWHRPHRTAPVRTGDQPPGAVRFAHRPAQPRADAPDARRGAAQFDAPAKGLRLVPDRPRSVQERQRHAWPSDRGRLAAAGRAAADQRDGRAWPGRAIGRGRVQGRASGRGRDRAAREPRADADRAGLAPLSDRGQPGHHRRLGRDRDRRPAKELRRQPDPQRRSRALCRQGRRARQAYVLRARDAQRGVGSPGARQRSPPGARSQRIVGRVPADRPRRERGFVGVRGAGAVEPPDPRPDLPRQVHPARRRVRDDRQDRRVRAQDRACRSRQMA